MKRIEKLLKALMAKIEYVRELCPDIPAIAEAEVVRDEFAHVLEILRDPTAAMNKRTVGFVASSAELAIVALRRDERRFLITLGTIANMRQKLGALHPETRHLMEASDMITGFDALRSNPKTTTFELRQAYTAFCELLTVMEDESNELNRFDTPERARFIHPVVVAAGRKSRRAAA